MGAIQSSVGLISGISIDDTVSKLIAVSAQPRDRLVNRNKGFQSQQVALNELLALTIGVQLSSDRLGRVSDFRSLSATSSNKEILSANAGSTAAEGTFTFRSIQLAQSSSFTSNVLTNAQQKVSAGDLVIRAGGFVDQSARLDELNGGAGVARGKIAITDRSGDSQEIDLRFAATIDDVIDKINAATDIKVSAKIDGDRIVLTDLTGSTTSRLKVEEVNGGTTAEDLGLSNIDVAANSANGQDIVYLGNATNLSSLRDQRGIRFGDGNDLNVTLRDGTELDIDLNPSATGEPSTLGELIARINAIDSGKLRAQIHSDGTRLELTDLTSGSGNFTIEDDQGHLASDLGISKSVAGSSIEGTRIQSGLNGPLLSSLRGNQGISQLGQIDITNRNGTTTQLNLSAAQTLSDVISTINQSGAGVVATWNSSRTGILVQDTTGATSNNLRIANGDGTNSADSLKIASDVSANSIDSGSLDFQFVHGRTKLSELNQGRGISTGTFTIADSLGARASINLTSGQIKSVDDLMDAINDLSIGVEAALSESGDGIVLLDTANGTEKLTVTDVGSGKAAADLKIAGQAKSINHQNTARQGIDGSQNLKISLEADDSLSDVVSAINSANGPVTASLLNAGPNQVRLLLNSRQSGQQGRVISEGGTTGLSFSLSAQARDAIIAVGATSSFGGSLVTSSTNQFSQVVTGVDLTLQSVSDQNVDVVVSSSSSTVEKNIQLFVDQFNKVVDKIKTLTKFDSATNSTGLLFGSTELLRVDLSLNRLVSGRINGAGDIKSLEQVGVSLSDDGKLSFDKEKLGQAIAKNPNAVQEFFTKADTGFSARAKKVIETLTGAERSVLVNRTKALQTQIESNQRRIESMTTRLDRERQRMLKQFYGLEQTIAKLQQNQQSIAKISPVTA